MKNANTYRTSVRLFRVLLIFVAMSGPILMLFENRLIYHPEKEELPDADFGLSVRYVKFKTADDVILRGAYVPAPNSRGVILWCHGNGGNLSYGFAAAREFQKFGASMFLFDYRGYGKSEGRSGGDGILLDAEAAYRFLTDEIQLPPSKIIILG